ncbi:MAG: transposase [Planctomycetes bacterium]|nr:transposase [Planctomycetota bacterium]
MVVFLVDECDGRLEQILEMHEVVHFLRPQLVEPALQEVIELSAVNPDAWPRRIIGDKAYDSDELRDMLHAVGIELLAPHRRNRTRSRSNDGRKMRRYRRRWKVERFFAWAGAFRRFLVRHERLLVTYRAVVHAVCLIITLRYL